MPQTRCVCIVPAEVLVKFSFSITFTVLNYSNSTITCLVPVNCKTRQYYAIAINCPTVLLSCLSYDNEVPPSLSNTNLTDIDHSNGYTPGDTATVTQGMLHEFTCAITGTRPVTQVSWFIGSEEQSRNINTDVQENDVDPLLSDTSSKFTFTPNREDHFTEVMCISFVVLARDVRTYAFPVKLEVFGKQCN